MKVLILFVLFPLQLFALNSPSWFQRDLNRQSKWLPSQIRKNGVEAIYQQNWAKLSPEAQNSLLQLAIPEWMIALIPTSDSGQLSEINKQLAGIKSLSGAAPTGELARRAEQLLIFAGAAQLPTPGDRLTGASLGPEGCTAAMSHYVLAQLKLENAQKLASMPEVLETTQSSSEMKALFQKLVKDGATWFSLKSYNFSDLKAQNVQPGSLMIAQKPGGTHVFGWTRVISFWGWSTSDKMAIGNTGLPQFGNRMILAQEYITEDLKSDNLHNDHGPINSHMIIRSNGEPVLSDPRTNVYAAQGSQFIVINLN